MKKFEKYPEVLKGTYLQQLLAAHVRNWVG